MNINKAVDLALLAQQVKAAIPSIAALSLAGTDLRTYDAAGVIIDIPPANQAAVQALVAAHVVPVDRSAIEEIKAEDFRTTDATQATMAVWPLAVQTLYRGRFTVLSFDVNDGTSSTWTAEASAKRLNGSALLVGTPVINPPLQNAGASSWQLTFDVNGNNFRARVTGVTGRTISWNLLGEVVRARPDGLVD